ncbi:DUF1294 domain-containing protein [Shewanella aestuarii]|uniref:DUF1294 domain-containing protein n=1 Tax=Shewanella aestuarii TaxID=1028752 RepID=A0A6G9QNE0_9GAMM|nr:DUF1294 domain-containing protein [Shewanella aestuarii]QIR15341.1 DUF1294 domain-containing protein [Shewanella aestuarii]
MKSFAWLIIALILGAMTLGYFVYQLSPLLPAAFIVINILSYAITWHDKRIATKNRVAQQTKTRISEKTLYSYAILGGWPAGILAQQHFRHKTQKQPFKAIYWGCIIVNVVLSALISYQYYQLTL